MAKTSTDTHDTSSQKKTHASSQTSEKKSQQKKKASTSAQNDEKQRRKEQARQEAKLMLKAEQAKKDVQKAEQKLAKAQARLDAARTEQQTIEQKLAALRLSPQEESHNGVANTSDELLTTFVAVQEVAVADDTPLSLTTPFIEQSTDTNDTTEVPDTLVAEAQDAMATQDNTSETAAQNSASEAPTEDTVPQAQDNTIATSLETDQPPVEGHVDIPDVSQAQSTSTSTETSGEETQSPQTTNTPDIEIGTDTAHMPLLSQDANTWPPPLIREEVAEAAQEVETSNASASNEATSSDEEQPHRRNSTTSRRTRRTNGA